MESIKLSIGLFLLVSWWLSYSAIVVASSLEKHQQRQIDPALVGLGDADSDGVIDARDQCPNTNKRLAVNNQGCPENVTETIKGTSNNCLWPLRNLTGSCTRRLAKRKAGCLSK